MSIGSKLKTAVLQKLGTAYTILRDAGDVTGEKLSYEINAQVTKPFIREHFLDAELSYDTVVVVGDVLEFDDERRFLAVNKTPEMFKNEVVVNSVVLYKANVSGELLRPATGTGGDANWDRQTMQRTTTFSSLRSPAYGLLTEALWGHDLITDQELGEIGLEQHELYMPSSYGAEINDKYVPEAGNSGEVYRLTTKKGRRYPGVDVFGLELDHR